MRDAEATWEAIFQKFIQQLFRNNGQLETESKNAYLEV